MVLKKVDKKKGLKNLVGPGGFEPPTSTMSRLIGRTKTRVDSSKLVVSDYGINHSQGLNRIDGALIGTRPAVKARWASKIRM